MQFHEEKFWGNTSDTLVHIGANLYSYVARIRATFSVCQLPPRQTPQRLFGHLLSVRWREKKCERPANLSVGDIQTSWVKANEHFALNSNFVMFCDALIRWKRVQWTSFTVLINLLQLCRVFYSAFLLQSCGKFSFIKSLHFDDKSCVANCEKFVNLKKGKTVKYNVRESFIFFQILRHWTKEFRRNLM